jgi:drug/metabolite transporter (DMT)-like permease
MLGEPGQPKMSFVASLVGRPSHLGRPIA